MEPPSETPGFIQALIEELQADPGLRFRAGDLRSRGIEPATVRRWFLRHHRMTFNAYQRMLRLNRVSVDASDGMTSEAAGTSSTSSKVSPSRPNLSSNDGKGGFEGEAMYQFTTTTSAFWNSFSVS